LCKSGETGAVSKADGSKRPLGIPVIRDRVVQMAAKLVVEPIFEADFCWHSYGFRPKKSAHDAIETIAYALNTEHTQVIDADLSKYFDTIPHDKLMRLVVSRIADGQVLHLIQMWIKAPVVEEGEDEAEEHRRLPEESEGYSARRSDLPASGQCLPSCSGSCVGAEQAAEQVGCTAGQICGRFRCPVQMGDGSSNERGSIGLVPS
jgi:hypothetical protein